MPNKFRFAPMRLEYGVGTGYPMPLIRKPHWDTEAFPQAIQANQSRPFKWGQWDCCLSAAYLVQAITGTQIADQFVGKYMDEASAFALIKSVTGGTTVADAAAYCASRWTLVEHPHALQAQRGDLVVVQNAERLIAGVVCPDGRHIVSAGERGLLYLPISLTQRSWRV